MADSHLQVNPDASTSMRKTTLWPSTLVEREEILRKIFSQQNWNVSCIYNVGGAHWKIETSCQHISYKINLYISSVRDEARQDDEFKMQLGNTYPTENEPGWITLILGIYTIADGDKPVDYILSAYSSNNIDFLGNPSIRGTRTNGLQMAHILGFHKTEKSFLFRPDFIYYYIQNQEDFDVCKNTTLRNDSFNLPLQQISSDNRPYLSALKTKPFMLLAGISGTGKSRIVRKLAQACWPLNSEQRMAQVPANFCMVQVKPNWHDSSELIGYVSRVSGKSEFVVGDFLKFVAQAWENWLSEDKKPYFLCLDEMNLAPVEQYFAEYLSVLESRKYNAETGEITSDPIIKNDAEGYSDLLFKLGWKDQTMYDKLSENGICLPPNLIVVGTVNMDETTFSFSRKVLDRAMVIEMNEVNLNGGLRKGADEWDNVELSATDVLPQFVEGKDFYERNEDTCNSIIEKLGLINDILDGTPFKIAYRTRNEVLLYILNRISEECSLEQALDEVVNMKILSRIEGDKNKVVDKEGNALLPKLIEVIKEVCGENEKSPSLLKLEEMKKKLDKQFYCSYWN